MRLAVYTDYAYRQLDGEVYAERAFALFVDALAERLGGLTLLGRLDPRPGSGRYRLSGAVRFVPLPFYETVTRPLSAISEVLRSLRTYRRALDEVDAVFLLGPHPVALLFALLTLLRRRTLVLGVRQDTGAYLRTRHPRRPWVRAIGHAVDLLWRLVARRGSVVVVGPEAARSYARAARVLEVAISLVRDEQIAAGAGREDWDGEQLELLSVGRLETEKNPLLLADVLAELVARDPRWRLTICGEGALAAALGERLEQLGVAAHADLRGYLPYDGGLADAYRSSHALLHVSWTEGLPGILFEAFAAGLPVVATDVGGIAAAVGEAVELIPPGERDAAVTALERLRDDPARRAELVAAGIASARAHTLDAEVGRVAAFVAEAAGRPLPAAGAAHG